MLRQPIVFIATPAYGGQVGVAYVNSLLGTLDLLAQHGVSSYPCITKSGAVLCHERNMMVWRFLQTKCTHLLFADADGGWEDNAVLRMFQRDKHVIAALAPRKLDGAPWPVDFVEPFVSVDGLLEAKRVGCHLMLIQRAVLERMTEAHPELLYMHDGERLHALFDYQLAQGGPAEDYAFCDRWRALGGSIFIEPNVKVVHSGQREWIGNWGELSDYDRHSAT